MDYIPPLSPGMILWCFRRERAMIGVERFAVQGVSVSDIATANVVESKRLGWFNSRCCQLGGEMVNMLSFTAYVFALLTELDLPESKV